MWKHKKGKVKMAANQLSVNRISAGVQKQQKIEINERKTLSNTSISILKNKLKVKLIFFMVHWKRRYNLQQQHQEKQSPKSFGKSETRLKPNRSNSNNQVLMMASKVVISNNSSSQRWMMIGRCASTEEDRFWRWLIDLEVLQVPGDWGQKNCTYR